MYNWRGSISVIFTPLLIKHNSTLFCALFTALRVEMLAVLSTLLPYYIIGLICFVCDVDGFMGALIGGSTQAFYKSQSLIDFYYSVCHVFLKDSLPSMCNSRYFIYSFLQRFWLLILKLKSSFLWHTIIRNPLPQEVQGFVHCLFEDCIMF